MKKQSYSRKQKEWKSIARERIEKLFDAAEKAFVKNPSLSNRYVTIARKIAMKCKVRIPKELKRRFCKHCYRYLVPGKNLRIRTHKGKVVYFCMECKKFMRFQYNR